MTTHKVFGFSSDLYGGAPLEPNEVPAEKLEPAAGTEAEEATTEEGEVVVTKGKNKNKNKKHKTKGSSSSNQGSYVAYKKCLEDHPRLELGGGVFLGGSCGYPAWTGADIYIGFQSGMNVEEFDPLVETVIHVQHTITDMCAPKDPVKFKNLVEWTAGQLAMGMTVHAGCIGGHGRTGTFLAALYKTIHPEEEDAITKVRELYCKKAVETREQIDFLHTHFGIKKVEPSKAPYVPPPPSPAPAYGGGSSKGWPYNSGASYPKTGSAELKGKRETTVTFQDATQMFTPVASPKNIFKAKVI